MGVRGKLPRSDGADRKSARRPAPPPLPREVQQDVARYYRGLRQIADRCLAAADAQSKIKPRTKQDYAAHERTLNAALRAIHATLQAGRHWAAANPAGLAEPKGDPLDEHLNARATGRATSEVRP